MQETYTEAFKCFVKRIPEPDVWRQLGICSVTYLVTAIAGHWPFFNVLYLGPQFLYSMCVQNSLQFSLTLCGVFVLIDSLEYLPRRWLLPWFTDRRVWIWHPGYRCCPRCVSGILYDHIILAIGWEKKHLGITWVFHLQYRRCLPAQGQNVGPLVSRFSQNKKLKLRETVENEKYATWLAFPSRWLSTWLYQLESSNAGCGLNSVAAYNLPWRR